MAQQSHRLLQLGAMLLLVALLIGVAIPALAVPRLGVAAHVNGLIGALFLVVFGLVWPRLQLGTSILTLAFWLAVYTFLLATLLPLLGGICSAGGSMFPVAGVEARGSAVLEGVISIGLATSALTGIAFSTLLVLGLRGRARPGLPAGV